MAVSNLIEILETTLRFRSLSIPKGVLEKFISDNVDASAPGFTAAAKSLIKTKGVPVNGN